MPWPAPKLTDKMGWAACPTLYAQHWTKVDTLTMTPYTARASVPRYAMIWRLNNIVSIPMATSDRKVENPLTSTWRSLVQGWLGRTSRRVFRLEKKWVSMTTKVMAAPMAVAKPAPRIPMSMGKTKTKSPNMLKMPPASTAPVAKAGLPSLRRKAASI